MASLPPRDSRVLQIVDLLQQEILSGTLQGDIPGERELARRLRVGRNTLRSAMQVLEDKKWVTPSKPGRRRQTLKHSKKNKTDAGVSALSCEGKTIVTLSPTRLEDHPSNEILDFTRLNTYFAGVGANLRHRPLDLSQLKRPAHRLQEFILQNPADLYLLQHAGKEVQKWFFQQKIPCVVLGSAWPDCDLPSVDRDQRALGRHASATLGRMGHRRLGLLYPEPEKRGMQLFVEGLRDSSEDLDLIIAKQDDTPESVQRALLSLVSDKATRPSVIILPRVTYVMTALGLLPTLGIRIPDDISLLCLVDDETHQFLYPKVAGYSVPMDVFPKAVFNLVVKCLMHPDAAITEHALIMPDFAPAESLGKAAGFNL